MNPVIDVHVGEGTERRLADDALDGATAGEERRWKTFTASWQACVSSILRVAAETS